MIVSKFNKVIYKTNFIKNPIKSKQPFSVIFLYHTIEESPSPWTFGHRYPTPYNVFKKQINYINKNFKVLATSELIERMEKGDLNENIAAIHFDDGFKSYLKLAVPFFNRYNISSSNFFINDVLEGDIPIRNKIAYCMNTGAKNAIINRTYEYFKDRSNNDVDIEKMGVSKFLSWIKNILDDDLENLLENVYRSHVKKMKIRSPFINIEESKILIKNPLVEFGSHTISHDMLSNLNEMDQRMEILDGHMKLEKIIGEDLNLFAYPFGGNNHFDDTSKKIVYNSEKLYAFSTYGGINYTLDKTDIKRITLTDHTPIKIKILLNNAIRRTSENIGIDNQLKAFL